MVMPSEGVGAIAVFDIDQAMANIGKFISGVAQVGAGIALEYAQMEKASNSNTSFAQSFGVASFAANLATQAFNFVTQSVEGFIAQSYTAVSELQKLQISLESLSAKEIKMSGMTDNMTDAMAQAVPMARDLMNQIRDLSVASPFEYQDVVQTFRMNMAFGQTSQTALDLTKAVLDMSAAMGTGAAGMQRITYNFSQMSRIGRVTNRDVRDLAMAGVDLSEVFKENLGKSVEEVDNALQSGQLTFQQVSEAFVKYADENFGGAAQRMSRTLEGLKSSFHDIMFFASIDLFGPLADRAAETLGAVLDRVTAFSQSDTFKKMGLGLETIGDIAFDQIDTWLGLNDAVVAANDSLNKSQVSFTQAGAGAASAGNDIQQKFIDKMSNIAQNALTWGVNIVSQLASGIIQGASGVLTQAMDFIGSILSWFLSPGSPPRVAEDIDKWGSAAMNEFLMGFTDADFNVLQSLQSPIKDALSTMSQAGLIGKDAVGGTYAELSKALASALDSGDTSGIFEKIAAETGPYGEQIADLARRQFDLAAATDKVRLAEEALNTSREKSSAAQSDLIDKINAFNQLAESGASGSDLEAKRKEYEQSKLLYSQSLKEESVASKALDTANASIDPLKKKVDLQQELVDQLLQISKMQLNGGAGAGAGGGGSGKGDGTGKDDKIALPDLSSIGGGFDTEAYKKDLKDKLAGIFQPLIDVWNNEAVPAWDTIKAKWETFSATVKQLWDEKISPMLDQIKKMFPPEFITNFGKVLGVALTLATGIGVLSAAFSILSAILSPEALLCLGIAFLITNIPLVWPTIQQLAVIIVYYMMQASDAANNLINIVKLIPLALWYVLEQASEAATNIAKVIGELIVLCIAKFIWFSQATGDTISNWVNAKIADFFRFQSNVTATIQTFLINLHYKFAGALVNIHNAINDKLESIKTLFHTVVDNVIAFMEGTPGRFWTIGASIMEGLKGGLEGKFDAIIQSVEDFVDRVVATAKGFLKIESPSKVMRDDIGIPMMEGWQEGINQGMDSLLHNMQYTQLPKMNAQFTTMLHSDNSSLIKAISSLGRANVNTSKTYVLNVNAGQFNGRSVINSYETLRIMS
jgi:tape measure domain-containing protein